MEPTRPNFRCLSFIAGLVIGLVALAAHGQALNITLASKTFSPAAIPVGGTSTLTVLITNSAGAQISGVTVTDTLPAGVTTVSFLTSAGCGVGSSFTTSPTTIAATVSVAAGSACSFSTIVTANAPGVYTNTTANISGWNGSALAFAPAVLAVGLNNPIPTLSYLSLAILALGLAVVAYWIGFRPAKSRRDTLV
jgi:uncharacterized repeat protein (TIGR01451 family)